MKGLKLQVTLLGTSLALLLLAYFVPTYLNFISLPVIWVLAGSTIAIGLIKGDSKNKKQSVTLIFSGLVIIAAAILWHGFTGYKFI